VFFGFVTRPNAAEPSAKEGPSHFQFWLTYLIAKLFFPTIFYLVISQFDQDLAIGIMLIAALPAAGISPALSRLTGGAIGLSLKILFWESVMACITIPSLFYLWVRTGPSVNPVEIMSYFGVVLILPLVLAEGIRRRFAEKCLEQAKVGSALSVGCILIMLFLVSAKVKPLVLTDPELMVKFLGIAFVLAPILAMVGILLVRRETKEVRVSYGIKNMFINVGLGLGVASTHLDESTTLFVLAYTLPINLLPKLIAKLAKMD
jgi:predicted Na+-dependent transporter